MVHQNKVWKLQRPLVSNEPEAMIMAYTEGGQQHALIPVAEEDLALLFGDEFKIYVLAKVENSNLVIDHQVEDQEW